MIVTTTNIPGLNKHITGKVRDVYDLGENLLLVASDRISAFDVVLPNGIPDKGRVLTQLSLFWFELTKGITENHLITADADEIVERLSQAGVADAGKYRETLEGRSMIVRKAKPAPIECVVRGYLSGSAWKEFSQLKSQTPDAKMVVLHGVALSAILRESDKLPAPFFMPATKELSGHDVNISLDRARELVGNDMADELAGKSISIYRKASEYAASRGIIISDTKFEFGAKDGKLILIDEVLTPDSSRFWDVELYTPGGPQPSFDKQYVRDYLETLDWDKTYPGPELPEEVVRRTSEKYKEAYWRIVGRGL
ncbi:MAG: phosphoribosylaminoimidazolesuccinocarboxamide synthase [Armatimonadota bacterium]|nr:phosphoribosylaminoimidazolesuccinocarboxamide synthase [Armatimonadota bacterium]